LKIRDGGGFYKKLGIIAENLSNSNKHEKNKKNITK
jgi:hypothetical protein